MCGRFALTTPPAVLAALRELAQLRFDLAPHFNIAPTQQIPAVRTAADGGRELVGMHWGLIPKWAKDRTIGSRMINARSETAHEKPAFRSAFKHRRCLIPATGFYEWRKITPKQKQPYFIQRRDHSPMMFGGLWELWVDKETGEAVDSCTILTTDANADVRPLHDRMPVMIAAADTDTWLDPELQDADSLRPLLRLAPEGVLVSHPVSRQVNSPRNDDPSLIDPVEAAEENDDAGDEGSALFSS